MNMNNTNHAIILLHEIYGVNDFTRYQCEKYKKLGFDVFCPNMLGRDEFSYELTEAAYTYFQVNVGFNSYTEIIQLIKQLKETYSKVFLIGFSVGATVAWRCCEYPLCDGIIACYGSRIRDYIEMIPYCPTLLIFATQDSFLVSEVVKELEYKRNTTVRLMEAQHGFMDLFSRNYDKEMSCEVELSMINFLSELTVTEIGDYKSPRYNEE